MHTFELRLGYTWWATQSTRTIRMYRSTGAAFFSSTHLCTRTEEQLVHVCLHKMYPRVFFKQEVFHRAKRDASRVHALLHTLFHQV